MSKKAQLYGAFTVLIIGLSSYFTIPQLGIKLITEYEPYTFEKVLNNADLRENYGINGYNDPADYGFEFQEIAFHSLDSTYLSGWYVSAKTPSAKSLVLVHGRTSNRLKTMKYLVLADSFGLDNTYNIFIPDFRNSGRSAKSKTFMGYKFGEDLTATMLLLHKKFEQDTFLLYGFSMGAMAVCNALGRPDLSEILEQNQLSVERVLFDSPLVNVKETLRMQSEAIPLMPLFFDQIFKKYDETIDGFGERMRLSVLFPPDIPLLILQSNNDKTTPKACLIKELDNMENFSDLTVEYFNGPAHVQMFQDTLTTGQYYRAISGFLDKTVKYRN